MKIAIIGSGAMRCLYGSYLARNREKYGSMMCGTIMWRQSMPMVYQLSVLTESFVSYPQATTIVTDIGKVDASAQQTSARPPASTPCGLLPTCQTGQCGQNPAPQTGHPAVAGQLPVKISCGRRFQYRPGSLSSLAWSAKCSGSATVNPPQPRSAPDRNAPREKRVSF